MVTSDQFERENQSLALSSCGATFASVVLAVITILAAFPQQFQIFEQVVSFLKVIFCLSILCSLFAVFSYLIRESKETVSDVLLYFSVITLVTSMLFLIPVVAIFL
jgi:hypothetical protein